ncbi:MAG TPA: FHA domain-containing protein [Roseiflexaceae bacterium]|nr:FHA domain-containing protein [Roseiflexaceae bacterium]
MTFRELAAGAAMLVALQPEAQPEEFALTGEPCTIGRSARCDIVVPRLEVSRHHATITREGLHFVIADAGSANGTFINGRQIVGPHHLKHHDEIGLAGRSPLFRFTDQDATTLLPRLLAFNQREQRFLYRGVALDLSPNLFRLLTHLFQHAGEICSHDSCIRAIWNDRASDPERIPLLHKEISELREKLQAIDPDAELIRTRRGMGYCLELG